VDAVGDCDVILGSILENSRLRALGSGSLKFLLTLEIFKLLNPSHALAFISCKQLAHCELLDVKHLFHVNSWHIVNC
jgi:hypothetical protein